MVWGLSPIAGRQAEGEYRGVDPVNPTSVVTTIDRAPEPSSRRPTGWIVLFVLALSGVWMTLVFGDEIGEWWAGFSETLGTPEAFRAWVEGFGAWGPVVYFLAQAAQVMVVPIPGALFPPVGALAFGSWAALGLSLAGMALGSAVVFLAARRWARPLTVRLLGEDRVDKYQNVITARGGLLLWVVFLLPLLPDDAVCALAGLSGISFRRFMLIATLGRVPAVAAGVFTMAGLEGAPGWVWLLAGSGFVLLMWLGSRYGRRLETWLLGTVRRDHPGSTTAPQPTSGEQTLVVQLPPAPRPKDHAGVLVVVVITTVVGVVAGVVAGVSRLATGMTLIWGVILAAIVASTRGAD